MRQGVTPRMIEMVQFRAQGMTQKEISRVTGLDVETVKSHCQRAMERMGANTMEHAVAMAARNGWLDEVEL